MKNFKKTLKTSLHKDCYWNHTDHSIVLRQTFNTPVSNTFFNIE